MFLRRPHPYVDESLSGYLHRVALLNGDVEISYMRRLLSVNRQEIDRNLFREESLKIISTLTNKNLARLARMTSNGHLEDLQIDYFKFIMLSSRVQYCPLCLHDGTHHRKIWCNSAIIVCPNHKVKLLNLCLCRKPFSYDSIVRDLCEYCNYKLSAIKTVVVMNEDLWNYQMQLVKLFTVPGSKIRITDLQLTMSQFVTLCRHSLALIRNSRSTIDDGIMVQDLTTGKENYSKGYSICEVIRLYEEFPNNFIQVLTKFFNSLKRTTRHKFDFEKLFANPLYDPIKLVYLDFAAAQQKKRINMGPSFLNRDLYPYISKTVACDILGVQYKVIVDLIKLRILKEVEINYQTLLIRDEVTKLLKLCKGEIMPLNDRVSIREVMPTFARKGITVAWLIFLIINGLLIPGSSERCISIMNVTFDKEVLQICLEQFEIINGLRKGTASMPNGKTDVQFGLATVTGKGVVFNDRVYSNTQMIKNQWFELALRTGSWTIPILYNPDEGEHLVLFDTAGLEVASSIEEGPEIEPAILESYYQALNSLKDQMKLFKQ